MASAFNIQMEASEMKSGIILSIDTATPACAAALVKDGLTLAEFMEPQENRHAELLPVAVSEMLKSTGFSPSQIEKVIFTGGPGSYTGLRIGISFLKGLFFGRKIQAVSVGTLALIAYAAHLAEPECNTVHGVIDARRQHLYFQTFEKRDNVLFAKKPPEIVEISIIRQVVKPGDLISGTGIQRLNGLPDGVRDGSAALPVPASLLVSAAAVFAGTLQAIETDLNSFEPEYLGAPV